MAIKSQQTALAVSTASAAGKVISAATNANPIQITSTSHGFTQGQIILITGVLGMIQVNGRAFVVDTPATNTFNLKGIDGTLYGTYASAGAASLQTMTPVGSINALSGFDGTSSEIDTTDLSSTAKSYLLGLQDFGNCTLGLFHTSDAGAAQLRTLKRTASSAAMSITMSDGTISAFVAFCKQFSFDTGGPDGAVKNSVSLRVTGEPAWFA